MPNELNEQMRAEFEAWAKEHFICTPHSFARAANGLYYNTVASRDAPVVYAAVSMLWATWQAARRQHGSAAQAVVVGSSEWADSIVGTEVSMDVSTGDDDHDHRIFGRVHSVTLASSGGGKSTLLADEVSRNFTAPPVADAERLLAWMRAKWTQGDQPNVATIVNAQGPEVLQWMADVDAALSRKAFREHLKQASETVATWPAWKGGKAEQPAAAQDLPPLPEPAERTPQGARRYSKDQMRERDAMWQRKLELNAARQHEARTLDNKVIHELYWEAQKAWVAQPTSHPTCAEIFAHKIANFLRG